MLLSLDCIPLILVKVGYPLKQGLKPFIFTITSIFNIVKVGYPLKQGLKPMLLSLDCIPLILVKVGYPLKQGLKQCT